MAAYILLETAQRVTALTIAGVPIQIDQDGKAEIPDDIIADNADAIAAHGFVLDGIVVAGPVTDVPHDALQAAADGGDEDAIAALAARQTAKDLEATEAAEIAAQTLADEQAAADETTAQQNAADEAAALAAAAEAKEANASDDTFLLGSDIQPASWTLTDGSLVQLGDAVAAAQAKSGFTAKEWNQLEQKDREQLLQDYVDLNITPNMTLAKVADTGSAE